MAKKNALLVFSGGQDSTTCLFWALKKFATVSTISFDYGQRHRPELECAKQLCSRLGIEQKIISINFLSQLSDNALTNPQASVLGTSQVGQGGEFSHLPSTFVPGRNALFLNLAVAYGVPRGIENYVMGVCETDYSGYPDCREVFIGQMEKALSLAVDKKLKFHVPLMYLTKAETFHMAMELDCLKDIIENTHSCYEGKRDVLNEWGYGCGVCPACVLRKKGFEDFKNFSKERTRPHGHT